MILEDSLHFPILSVPVTGKSLKFVDFVVVCTADLQADGDQNYLNNNLKIDELETSARDCSVLKTSQI